MASAKDAKRIRKLMFRASEHERKKRVAFAKSKSLAEQVKKKAEGKMYRLLHVVDGILIMTFHLLHVLGNELINHGSK